jgi:hypothetical protein
MSGWDELEAQVSVQEDDLPKMDIDLLMARAFGTEEGMKVLAWMREKYLEQPCWHPGADASLGQWREGQNAVIRDIEARIRKAKSRT